MLTPNMAANPSPAHGPSEEVRPATGYGREFRRPLPLAFLILAVLGWLAAAYSFWRAPDGQESQGKAPAGHSEVEATRAVTEADPKLATASSALTATIRLRDEAAQSLQEVRERSAGVGKDLAAARDQLENIEQQIKARNSDLATIDKRLETARLRESRPQAEPAPAPAAPPAATPAAPPAAAPAAAPAAPPAAAATAPVTAAIAPAAPATAPATAATAPATAATAPVTAAPIASDEASAERKPIRKGKSHGDDRSPSVIGPGDFSSPSKFELHGGRTTRTP